MEIPDLGTKAHFFLSAERVQFQSQGKSPIYECMEFRMPEN